MATVHFTARLRPLVPAEGVETAAATVGGALDEVFANNLQARGYVLDEQGRLRKHVCIFLDGERLGNGIALAAPLAKQSEIHVMQALSGG
ncbi:MAG: MoaD/ThiS family protein [Rhizomicrobium sp.]